MTHTVSFALKNDNGTTKNIIIEPVVTQAANNHPDFTGVYTLYKGTAKGVSHLIELQDIAPEIGESNPLTDDDANPDFLGRLTYNKDSSSLVYTGGRLSKTEQDQIIEFIKNEK